MDRSKLTVTMPMHEFVLLESKADGFNCLIQNVGKGKQRWKGCNDRQIKD